MKPEFFEDEDLAELGFWIRILYQGLWVLADRDGRLEDRPIRIKAKIFPYDKVNVEDGLLLLAGPKKHSPNHPPFIIRYEINGEKYIQILNFDKHQSPHNTEKESMIPPFNGSLTVKEPLKNLGVQDAQEQETINLSKISFQNLSWEGIGNDDKKSWAEAYTACDIDRELLAMVEWMKSNPKKAKKENYRRFITNWLSRSQERGGGMKSNGYGAPAETPEERSKRLTDEHIAYSKLRSENNQAYLKGEIK